MGMGQGVRAGLGYGGITCVLQTQFSSFCRAVSMLLNLQQSSHFAQGVETRSC